MSTNSASFEYVRRVDVAAQDATAGRFTQRLFDLESGAESCTVSYHKTPPGGGSLAGLHFHEVEQVLYVLKGTVSVEIAGETHQAGPGTLVVFPARVHHRNWNAGTEETIHLGIMAPAIAHELATKVRPEA